MNVQPPTQLSVAGPHEGAALMDRLAMKNFLPMMKSHRTLLIVVFLLTGALRVLLAVVNQEANDNIDERILNEADAAACHSPGEPIARL